MQLDKNIHQIVRRVLNEELGIDTETYQVSNAILSKIQEDIPKQQPKPAPILNAVKKTNTFSIDFYGAKLLVQYVNYEFKTDKEYQDAIKKNAPKLCNAYAQFISKDDLKIFVVYNSTLESGFDNSVRDRIQHELNHIHKNLKANKQLTKDGLATKVYNILHNKKEPLRNDLNIRRAAFLLYYSKKYEQDAFGNGLYNWLLNGDDDPNFIIYNSGIYKNIQQMKKSLSYFQQLYDNNDINAKNEIKQYYGITLGQLLNKGGIALERSKKILNRVIYKYGQETGKRIKFIG